MQNHNSQQLRIGIIGGGIGGATIALRLIEQSAQVVLFEKEPHLVNGPPMCHLHAGGNLYREISDEQCIDLLKQSIDTAKFYREAIDCRPTIVAVPTLDDGHPEDVISRLNILQQEYAKLIDVDPTNEVLGPASQYYTLFNRSDLEQIANLPIPNEPANPEQWMINFAQHVDLDQLKYPIILVQEYGISAFRLAAITNLALERSEHCQLLTNTRVKSVSQDNANGTWQIETESADSNQAVEVDYLINACGFRTGTIDDMIGLLPKRMVEFKAAYVSQWTHCQNTWPEIIFYGTRGTKNGMTQLTPYPNGYFQIHAMTPDVTLFEDGLVASKEESAQPQLPQKFITKVDRHWDPAIVNSRTEKAIDKVAKFIPHFESAIVGGPPMYGAQQIPGVDSTLRVADVAFQHDRYARCEIVKASSALPAANTIINKLVESGLLNAVTAESHPATSKLSEIDIKDHAELLATKRKYPKDLAGRVRADG